MYLIKIAYCWYNINNIMFCFAVNLKNANVNIHKNSQKIDQLLDVRAQEPQLEFETQAAIPKLSSLVQLADFEDQLQSPEFLEQIVSNYLKSYY